MPHGLDWEEWINEHGETFAVGEYVYLRTPHSHIYMDPSGKLVEAVSAGPCGACGRAIFYRDPILHLGRRRFCLHCVSHKAGT